MQGRGPTRKAGRTFGPLRATRSCRFELLQWDRSRDPGDPPSPSRCGRGAVYKVSNHEVLWTLPSIQIPSSKGVIAKFFQRRTWICHPGPGARLRARMTVGFASVCRALTLHLWATATYIYSKEVGPPVFVKIKKANRDGAFVFPVLWLEGISYFQS